MTAAPSRGRRPGTPDTRGDIVEAARRSFAEHGYDRTSMRAVARAAGVDPALVHHYFAGKEDLFLAAMEMPFDPRELLPPVLTGRPDELGERLVRVVLEVWDGPARPQLLGVMRAGLATESASSLLRDGLLRLILAQIAAVPGIDEPSRRASLVAAQVVGLLVTRYVVPVEPLASMPADQVAALVGPTLQRYVYG
ncbi:MAG: TetR family transcriptional regulator [Nocardioidaceae bacterium]